MEKLKVRAHTCYLSNTGYASHARGFFRELSKYVDLRVRNFNWESADKLKKYINDTDLEVLDQITLSVSEDQRRDFNIANVDEFKEFNWKNSPDGFKQDVDIVLIESTHHYFFEEYNAKYKIAYTVWESTQIPEHFLGIIQKFDAVWVVSKWHRDCLIKQGVEPDKIWIVPEGVDSDFNSDNKFSLVDEYNDDRFKFLFFGRWDYRKSVPEIIQSFLEEFGPDEPVDLVLSADNPFSIDGLNSTEERLNHYGLNSDKIKVKHFPSREDYVSYLHNGHAMITCARSEGWNIPLCEAIAAGIPVTYSNWGAQLEFCEGLGNPVDIISEVPAIEGEGKSYRKGFTFTGNYCLPDYQHLKKVLRHIYQNYSSEKQKAIEYSKQIRDRFNWVRIGEIGFEVLQNTINSNKKIGVCLSSQPNFETSLEQFKNLGVDTLMVSDKPIYDSNFLIYSNQIVDQVTTSIEFAKNLGYSKINFILWGNQFSFKLSLPTQEIKNLYESKRSELETPKISLNFIDGPHVDVFCSKPSKYIVSFIDSVNNELVYQTTIDNNCWCAPNRRYFTDWLIQVHDESNNLILNHKFDAKDKNVFVCLESGSLGDSIAWFSGIDEFRKKHQCKMIVSMFKSELFKSKYPEIEFIPPGSGVNNLYALYRIGWYYVDGNIDINRHPIDPKARPMQATSFDILGVPFEQVRPLISLPDLPSQIEGDYVCIGMHATAQSKYWNNPTGWQELVDWFNSIGYKVVLISKEAGAFMGNNPPANIIDKTGDLPLEDRILDLKHAKMFIGVGSGLSWLAWVVGTPVTLISGFSNPQTEFIGDDVLRIFNPDSCNSCFNRHMLDGGDWWWCPDYKGTERQFECTKSITGQMVISKIQDFLTKL